MMQRSVMQNVVLWILAAYKRVLSPRMPVACLIGSIRQATFTYFSRRPSATAVPRSSRRRGVSAGCLRSSRRYTAAR